MNIAEALKKMCEGNPEFYKKLQEDREKCSFIRRLTHMRVVVHRLSNKDMAKAMGCSPQKVTRMEYSYDDDLKVGDIKKYLAALGYELVLIVQHKEKEE